MDYKSVSIVISNYNGKKLLEKFLPSVVEAAKSYKGQTEIIIVDDAGTDGSDEFVKNNFSGIKLIRLKKNIGPLLATNEGIKASKNQIIILLDNDVLVAKDFIYPLVAHFDDEDIFGVMPSVDLLSPESGKKESEMFTRGLELRKGFIETPIVKLKEAQEKNFIFLLGGGAAALDRNKLLKIGAWDELLSPFYWEDVDLSYRAWRRGWKVLYELKSQVHHQASSTINKEHGRHYIDMIAERNRYILVWKNILDKRLLFYHLLWVPMRLIWFLLIGKWWRVSSFFLALGKLKEINQKRKIELREAKVSDAELFDLFSKIMRDSSRF